jgi:transcription initiation factor TFIID subunit TAF12
LGLLDEGGFFLKSAPRFSWVTLVTVVVLGVGLAFGLDWAAIHAGRPSSSTVVDNNGSSSTPVDNQAPTDYQQQQLRIQQEQLRLQQQQQQQQQLERLQQQAPLTSSGCTIGGSC